MVRGAWIPVWENVENMDLLLEQIEVEKWSILQIIVICFCKKEMLMTAVLVLTDEETR